jgi:hypothetical protein
MAIKPRISSVSKILALALTCTLLQCSDEEVLPTDSSTAEEDMVTSATATSDCGCTYVVPPNTWLVDAKALGLKPGSVICLQAGSAYANLLFRNIIGTATAPIVIKNCGGAVTLNASGKHYAMKTELSKYFRITGGSGSTYGIKLSGGHQGLMLDKLTTNVEVDHLEIANPGFAGIMAKTDPVCGDNTALRGNFVMRDVSLHHNYVHDTGGEGFYVGNSFYTAGMNTSCGTKMPHIIEGVKIYNNIVKNSGWEAIQVGSAPKGAEVYNNRIENYGVKNVKYQKNGVQFGEGAPGKFYGNFIKGGKGIGLFLLGNAENFVHDNVFVNTGEDGIFCDERDAVGTGFKFINNTIINPGLNGIRIYAEKVPMNSVINNIIVNPGSYSTYTYPRTGNDAYVYLLGKNVRVQMANNHFTRDIGTVKFQNTASFNYGLTSSSPAVNKGYNVASYNILLDFNLQSRLKGAAYDIGACEY